LKELFSGFYPLKPEDYKGLWKNAYFIFDTNVLLNLYRYNKSTSEELLAVIESLGDKVWIPYIVGLEYQRNRLKVIADQNSKFKKVEGIILNGIESIENKLGQLSLQKKHSSIEPDTFIENLKKEADKFIDSLNKLEEEHPSVMKEDSIRNQLNQILEGKIGSRVDSQKDIDKLESEAKKRFDLSIPPGYRDLGKGKSDDSTFTYDDIKYNTPYSDYLLWNDIIEFSKDEKVSNVFFVTDDAKEDWWYKINQNGPKVISPRPELISEIKAKSNINVFHMYSSENFLKFANEALDDIKVSSEAIKEVKDITHEYASDILKLLYEGGSNHDKKVVKYINYLDQEAIISKQKEEDATSKPVIDLYYEELPEFAKSVVELIDDHLQNGIPPNSDSIANDLGMSYQTFRRKLGSVYSSFQILKDFTRYRLVFRLLMDGERCFKELSLRSGFTEESTFHRAFKGWTGMTVSNFIRYKIEFDGEI